IQCEIHPENAVSQRMVERVGFQREGVLRRTYFSRGTWRDTVMFSILREEWGAPRILSLEEPA
ncbi:MAG: GNAT family N-acetyltransferase, partial [Candidatus Limnocylindrales bacterium]